MFSIETAMRAGEIAGLIWDRVNLEKRTARLIETKNGYKRDVPLSTEAIRILNQVKTDSESVFCLKPDQIDVNFRKAKSRAMIEDLHFHDARATAITNISVIHGHPFSGTKICLSARVMLIIYITALMLHQKIKALVEMIHCCASMLFPVQPAKESDTQPSHTGQQINKLAFQYRLNRVTLHRKAIQCRFEYQVIGLQSCYF